MSDPPSIDDLVRAHLDQQAEQIDPRPRLHRLKVRLGQVRRWLWPAAAAAAVLLVFALGQSRTPALASAEQIVRESEKVHHLPVDRCYLVEIRKESELLEEGSPAVPAKLTRVWTRGDRFWVESVNPQHRWAWGRDDRGRMWMAFGARFGLSIEPDEMPRWLVHYCDTLSLQPEKLLNEVLKHFEMKRESSDASTQIVRATRKLMPQYASVRAAILEIDSETKVLRRLSLERMRQGRHVATVTYTLTDTQLQEDSQYELEGHLTAPYEVFTRENKPQRRQQLMERWFGPIANTMFGDPRKK